jgi:DTW domain-containing protein YfiP
MTASPADPSALAAPRPEPATAHPPEPRACCARCGRPVVVCYCPHVREVPTRTRVLILQHPREADVPINTARIARLCLPNSELIETVEADREPAVRALIARAAEGGVGLLFPGDETADIHALGTAPDGSRTLVVVDGTWWQASKVLRRSPGLASLPRYGLVPSAPSNYRIRREPSIECLSTLEALSEALAALEGPALDPRALLDPFDAMVEFQLAYARSGAGYGRHRPRPVLDRRREVPPELARTPTGVVVAYGESNAWPVDTPSRPPAELVHWVAERLDDGTRAEWILRPRQPLAPDTPTHTGLDEASFSRGISWDQFSAEWQAFTRHTPVLATWNTFAVELLHRESVARAEPLVRDWLDLRPAVARFFKRKAGSLAESSPRFGPMTEPPWAPGRAGTRIQHALHVARALRAEALRPLAR